MGAMGFNTVGMPHGSDLDRFEMLGAGPPWFYVRYKNKSYKRLWCKGLS